VRALTIAFGALLTGPFAGQAVAAPAGQPDFGCSIHAIVEFGGASGDVTLGGCRVALKGVILRFPQRERSRTYMVQNRPGANVVGRTRGSGTTTLSFSFPTPLLPGGKAPGGLLTRLFGVRFEPAVDAGGRITFRLIATSGRAQVLQVTVRRLKCPHGVVCSGS
jgi:hypothetical protein